jgi:hypothetical protein
LICQGLSFQEMELKIKVTNHTKEDDNEIPTLTGLEAENIITRKKAKDREKPILTGVEAENIPSKKK